MRIRSPRNRSWENSNGTPPGSVVVRVIASSGAPAGTSRTTASSCDAATTSIRSTASPGRVPKCSSSSSYSEPPSGSSTSPGKRSAGSMTRSPEMGLPSASRIRTRSITRSPRWMPSARAAGSPAPDSPALITRVPATTPWLRSRAGTPTTRDVSRSILSWLTKVPPPRPGTRRTTPVSASTARAWRSVARLTPRSDARARSAPSRWPGRRCPAEIRSVSTRRTSSGVSTLGIHGTQGFREHLPAVDHDGLPGDVGGLVGGQEQRRVADLVHRAEAAQRHAGRHLPHVLLAEIDQALGDHVAGQHRVDRDAVRREFEGGAAHETELACLARAVVRPAGEPGDWPGDGRGEDDPAMRGLLQGGQAGLDGQDAAPQVGAEHGVQVLVGHVREPR